MSPLHPFPRKPQFCLFVFFLPVLVLSSLELQVNGNYIANTLLCLLLSMAVRFIHVVAQLAVHLFFLMSSISCYEHSIIYLFSRLELL